MPKEKAPKLFGCAACPWGEHKPQMFVQPEEPVDPNLIVLGEAPGKTELEDGVPFVGRAGELLRDILSGVGARPVIVNSANCFNEDKPTTEVITACREAYVKPTLDKYPGLPILSLGNFAASSILKEPRLFIKAEAAGLKCPWCGTKVTLLGVSSLNTPTHIIPTSHQEYKE